MGTIKLVLTTCLRPHSRTVVGHRLYSDCGGHADVVVVGGGVIGASTAYHLAKRGRGSGVVMLEAEKLTSGTTWHSAAMLNTLRGTVTEAAMMNYCKNLVTDILEEETGISPGYIRHGGLTLTTQKDRVQEFKRWVSLAR